MKTNFKTLALQAGIGAALAAGSMSASAVITAVPAPAQLIPLFFYADGSTDDQGNPTANGVDTGVRVIVPKSVGADTVIDIVRGDSGLAPQANWNSNQQFATTKQIHYWVMNTSSEEIHNDKFTVTPDDEVYFYASTVLNGASSASINGSTIVGAGVGSGSPTYLILTTEAAINGSNPDFMFTAEAWLENTGASTSMASAVTIPVLGLADAADTTSFPTPGNNVIEAYTGTAAGPIASPIHTGIRTSGTGAVGDVRVVDVPVHADNGTEQSNNTIVVWTDANNTYENIKQYNVNNAEGQVSRGTISFPNQLNFREVNFNSTVGASSIGLADGYSSYLGDTNLQNGGFVKLVMPAVTLPTDWTEAGAYNSVVIFNIPSIANVTPSATNRDTDASELAIDTGWFTAQ